MLRVEEREVHVWVHALRPSELGGRSVRLTPDEARELAALLLRQAELVEHTPVTMQRCTTCDGVGVDPDNDELYCARCDGAGTIRRAGSQPGL